MQTVVVFAALICAAAAQTVVNSNRVGGNFAYSVTDNKGWAVAPATTYATNWAGVSPYYNNWNGVHWNGAVAAHHVAPVAVARSVVAANTPAGTYKTLAGVSPLSWSSSWPSQQWVY